MCAFSASMYESNRVRENHVRAVSIGRCTHWSMCKSHQQIHTHYTYIVFSFYPFMYKMFGFTFLSMAKCAASLSLGDVTVSGISASIRSFTETNADAIRTQRWVALCHGYTWHCHNKLQASGGSCYFSCFNYILTYIVFPLPYLQAERKRKVAHSFVGAVYDLHALFFLSYMRAEMQRPLDV